ncbi:MAG: hypothetical protein KGS49_18735, partial [Planctomycetes bacterium]|nr:hypothetical protein [Planctomycetota bacterium]
MSRLHSFLSPSSAPSPRPYESTIQSQDDLSGLGVGDGERSFGSLNAPPSIGFPHRLFVPEHYESGYAYPLLVWLHSDHSSEYELDSVMHSLSMRNYAAV